MRAFAAVPIALALCAAPAVAAPRNHAAAAKRAERKNEWRRALREWKAAYANDAKSEYLIGIGDAYAHLGKNAEAKKSYEAYLADPLAVPGRIAKVKEKIAGLEQAAAESSLPALPLPVKAASPPKVEVAKDADPPLPVPRREPPVVAPPARAEVTEVAKPEALPAVASNDVAPRPAKIAIAANPVAERQAPIAAFSAAPLPVHPSTGSGRVQRTFAYVTAGVAIAALGGGALAYVQAGSTHNELTGGIHSPADTQRLLNDESRYRTLSLVGLVGGLVTAGVATALFVF
jgi:hypothetical protein